ncbi:MAG: M20/M25/M40 family metallo-hydrolase [Candidatus Dormibacteria bacterium]|jgi:glutamate carboxypeptidase
MTPTSPGPAAALLEGLRRRQTEMLECLETLVNHESPSSEPGSLALALDAVDSMLAHLAAAGGRRIDVAGATHLLWETARPRVLLLCHVDTVWPRGTLERWPFRVEGNRASGPGVADMKAGIVQALFAISALGTPEGVRLLVTTDEEIGSPTSRGLIEEQAAGVEAALVLEAAHEGALKVARKGTAQYTVRIAGRAAHASEPAHGANAALEMARQMLDIAGLADSELGTTVTPTVASAGTTANTVPAQAEFRVDSRAASLSELERIREAMLALRPHLEGTEVTVSGGVERLPMPRQISSGLFERAQALAATLGLAPLRGVLAPGGSDGQFTAAIGTPTLDGLGAVGGNAHAEGEWVEVDRMPERAALLAALLRDILHEAAA